MALVPCQSPTVIKFVSNVTSPGSSLESQKSPVGPIREEEKSFSLIPMTKSPCHAVLDILNLLSGGGGGGTQDSDTPRQIMILPCCIGFWCWCWSIDGVFVLRRNKSSLLILISLNTCQQRYYSLSPSIFRQSTVETRELPTSLILCRLQEHYL